MKKMNESLEERMHHYEDAYRIYFSPRIPLILRLDGVSFHTFTKGFQKPYDIAFSQAMQMTLEDLVKHIQGAKFGYTSSDEISIVLTDYDNLNTTPWFGKNLQKISSVAASMATYYFAENFQCTITDFWENDPFHATSNRSIHQAHYETRPAFFDCRAFLLPKEEVNNYFIWRQNNCVTNSVSSLARCYFPQSQLNHTRNEGMQLLLAQRGHKWTDMPWTYRYGIGCKRYPDSYGRLKWSLDSRIPLFSEHPEYINNCIGENV